MQKLIPFYRELDKDEQGFTLLLDKRSEQVYKVEHRKVNQYKFWIAWAFALALLRIIKDVHLSMGNPVNILIVVILVVISALVGVRKYKDVYKDIREVYHAQGLINEYIYIGKNLLKREVITRVIILVVFTIIIVTFLINNGIILICFVVLCIGGFIY